MDKPIPDVPEVGKRARLKGRLNDLAAAARSRRPGRVPGMLRKWGPNGFRYLPFPSDEAEASPVEIKRVTVQGVGLDTLTCLDRNGQTYQVAKPWRLRQSTYEMQANDLGNGATIVSTGVQSRRVTGTFGAGGQQVSEDQSVTPQYVAETEELMIVRVDPDEIDLIGLDNRPVEWMDMNVAARSWAARAVLYQ